MPVRNIVIGQSPSTAIRQRAKELRQNPYPVRKVMAQSTHYSMEQLHTVYRRLLDTDVEIKTGRLEPILALDTLIAGLSRSP